MRALYPGETAANANGQAHRFYKDLTYEHTMEMYDRFYRFDNALILLYGDLDWKPGFWHSWIKSICVMQRKAMEKKTDGVSSQAAGDRKNRKCRI